jgi:hypothetical protein
MSWSDNLKEQILVLAHVLVGEPEPTSPGHALGASLRDLFFVLFLFFLFFFLIVVSGFGTFQHG